MMTKILLLGLSFALVFCRTTEVNRRNISHAEPDITTDPQFIEIENDLNTLREKIKTFETDPSYAEDRTAAEIEFRSVVKGLSSLTNEQVRAMIDSGEWKKILERIHAIDALTNPTQKRTPTDRTAPTDVNGSKTSEDKNETAESTASADNADSSEGATKKPGEKEFMQSGHAIFAISLGVVGIITAAAGFIAHTSIEKIVKEDYLKSIKVKAAEGPMRTPTEAEVNKLHDVVMKKTGVGIGGKTSSRIMSLVGIGLPLTTAILGVVLLTQEEFNPGLFYATSVALLLGTAMQLVQGGTIFSISSGLIPPLERTVLRSAILKTADVRTVHQIFQNSATEVQFKNLLEGQEIYKVYPEAFRENLRSTEKMFLGSVHTSLNQNIDETYLKGLNYKTSSMPRRALRGVGAVLGLMILGLGGLSVYNVARAIDRTKLVEGVDPVKDILLYAETLVYKWAGMKAQAG